MILKNSVPGIVVQRNSVDDFCIDCSKIDISSFTDLTNSSEFSGNFKVLRSGSGDELQATDVFMRSNASEVGGYIDFQNL